MFQDTKNTSHQSAISRVPRSGLELVPKRKPRGKLATQHDYAKIDWKPWKRNGNELIPSNADFERCGVPARMAYAVMTTSRDELIAGHGNVDHKHFDAMMTNFVETSEWLKSVAAMIEHAYLRILASACAYNLKGGKFKGVHDMRRKRRTPRRAH